MAIIVFFIFLLSFYPSSLQLAIREATQVATLSTPTLLGINTQKNSTAQLKVSGTTVLPTVAHTTPLITKWSEFDQEETVENKDVDGCLWPHSYLQRLDFCQHKAQLINGNELNGGSFVPLDSQLLSQLLTECHSNPQSCGKKNVSNFDYDGYIEFWRNNTEKYIILESCLKQNTKGMVELCGGSESKIGKIISGAAGLHLNLLAILIGVATDLQVNNMTEGCLISTAVSAHLTAALYVESKSFKENSVMCWDVSTKCSPLCAEFASSLKCLSNSCGDFQPPNLLKQFPIWQWYYNSPENVDRFCGLDSSVSCEKGPNAKIIATGPGDSLGEKAVRKLKEIRLSLENYFHRPIYIIGGLFAASLLLLIAVVGVFCWWYQAKKPSRNRVIRYKILGEKPEADESRPLEVENQFDDVE